MTGHNKKNGQPKPPAMVHVDLDGASTIFKVHGLDYPFEDDPLFATGLKNMLPLFEELEISSTLFIIANYLENPQHLNLVRKAVSKGHEAASHSYSHFRLSSQDNDDLKKELVSSREIIQSSLNTHVNGFRAPQFNIKPDMFPMLQNAGYCYDSSVFPNSSFAARLGIKQISSGPHQPFLNCDIVELPLPGYKPLPFPFHPSYSLIFGRSYFKLGLNLFRRTGFPLILLFHLTDFADPLPDRMLQNWKAKFYTLSFIKAEQKIKRVKYFISLIKQHFQIVPTNLLLRRYLPREIEEQRGIH